MLPPFRFGVGGPLGSGRQWWSWIHRSDLVRMFVDAATQGWDGAFNATAPGAVRQKDFAKILGDVLGRPAVIPAPEFALRAIFGEFSAELFNSKRVTPRRTLDQGFEFRFGELRPALISLLD